MEPKLSCLCKKVMNCQQLDKFDVDGMLNVGNLYRFTCIDCKHVAMFYEYA